MTLFSQPQIASNELQEAADAAGRSAAQEDPRREDPKPQDAFGPLTGAAQPAAGKKRRQKRARLGASTAAEQQ